MFLGKKSRNGHAVVFPVVGGNPSITVTVLLPPRKLESAVVLTALETRIAKSRGMRKKSKSLTKGDI